jgi:hypothetical protein
MHCFELGLHRKDAGVMGNSSKGSGWRGGGWRGAHGDGARPRSSIEESGAREDTEEGEKGPVRVLTAT